MATGVWRQETLRSTGQEVILATMPVDPRDILRGDYVDLAYEIGRSEKALAFAKTLPESGPVYATLILGEDNRIRDYSFSTTEPKGGVYIRGEGFVHLIDVYTENKDNT